MTSVMNGATAPEQTDVQTAGTTRNKRSWRVRKENRSRIDGFGRSSELSTAVTATDCTDSCAERGSLYVEDVGDVSVLGAPFRSVSMVRPAGRPMVVDRGKARGAREPLSEKDPSLLSK